MIALETPEVRKELDSKDVKLEKYLKDVFVTSTGSVRILQSLDEK